MATPLLVQTRFCAVGRTVCSVSRPPIRTTRWVASGWTPTPISLSSAAPPKGPIRLPAPPSAANQHHAAYVRLLLSNYRRLLHADLAGVSLDDPDFARTLYESPYAIISHGNEADPIYNYANLTAQRLFEMSWERFTSIPSRSTTDEMRQADRDAFVQATREHGYQSGYPGVRTSDKGRRFQLRNCTLFNLVDEDGDYRGQAVVTNEFEYL
eukprot:EG_transcript_30060